MLNNQLIGQDKFIKVLPNTRKYLVEDFIDFSNTFIFGAKTPEEVIIEEIKKDYYSFEEYEGVNYVRFAEGFPIETYDRIKVLKAEDMVSVPVHFTTVSSITPDALNRNFDTLGEITRVIQEIFNNRALRIDAPDGEVLLPKLQEGEVWVKSAEGYRAMNVVEVEETFRQLKEEIVILGTNTLETIKNAETPKIAEAERKALESVGKKLDEVLVSFEREVTETTETSLGEIAGAKEGATLEISKIKAETLTAITTAKNGAISELNRVVSDFKAELEVLKQEIIVTMNNKLDKTGGTITGNLLVTGNIVSNNNITAVLGG